MTSPLVDGATLRSALAGPTPPLLLDARLGRTAAERYRRGHLPGAVRVDLEADLSAPTDDPAVGGRHPLPSLATFAETLGRLGVTPARAVVVYDDASGARAAARAWWMLRAVEHRSVRVLDGGLDAALAAGIALEEGEVTPTPTTPYPVPPTWRMPQVDADAVETLRKAPGTLLDVRSRARFLGEAPDPFEPSPGRIEGATSAPLALRLGADGCFLPRAALREALGAYPAPLAVSCGSGVTACHTILAFVHAGLPAPALYVGSYSEWSRSGRPTTRG
jgi:thiosulfate/3-mercaptopyruvate sulfurtransferase